MDLGALPLIRCRAARIHQVIVNLLTNAIDACSDDEGVVTVHTQTEPEEMGVRIVIEDNGTGIDPEIRERIFDPFFTTKPLGQGTGLGLSISYGIIQEHGGRIEVQSTVGCGSCFTLHLPVEPQQALADSDLPALTILDDAADEGASRQNSSHSDPSTAPDTADALSVTPAIQTGELEP
jgi:signal transduction histidine kinase